MERDSRGNTRQVPSGATSGEIRHRQGDHVVRVRRVRVVRRRRVVVMVMIILMLEHDGHVPCSGVEGYVMMPVRKHAEG